MDGILLIVFAALITMLVLPFAAGGVSDSLQHGQQRALAVRSKGKHRL